MCVHGHTTNKDLICDNNKIKLDVHRNTDWFCLCWRFVTGPRWVAQAGTEACVSCTGVYPKQGEGRSSGGPHPACARQPGKEKQHHERDGRMCELAELNSEPSNSPYQANTTRTSQTKTLQEKESPGPITLGRAAHKGLHRAVADGAGQIRKTHTAESSGCIPGGQARSALKSISTTESRKRPT